MLLLLLLQGMGIEGRDEKVGMNSSGAEAVCQEDDALPTSGSHVCCQ